MKKRLLLIAVVALTFLMTMSAFAAIDFRFELEEGADGVNKVVAYLTDTDTVYDNALLEETNGNFRALQAVLTYDADIFVPYDWEYNESADIDAYPESPFEAMVSGRNKGTLAGVKYSVSGNKVTATVDQSYQPTLGKAGTYVYPNNTPVLKFYFTYADGKSAEDFVSESFTVDFLDYVNPSFNYYNHTDASKNNITVANNVVPEAAKITISVAAGDKVYLQDGTVVTMDAANEAYELPATVGYVVVNTGKSAQKTYYVDGKSAVVAHTNGVLGSDTVSLRDRTPVEANDGNAQTDRNGLRFAMSASASARTNATHEIVESGFLMTAKSAKVTAALGEDFELIYGGQYILTGVAYDKANGIDKRYAQTDDALDIRATFFNIPITEAGVQTAIISRPYYRMADNTVVYGEATETSLYIVAKMYKESAGFEALEDSQKDYINEIIAAVEGWTEIIEDEIVIDISGLYGE